MQYSTESPDSQVLSKQESIPTNELLEMMASTYQRYVALPEGGGTILALWTLFSHAHDAFRISPLLVISSPEKRCGKTTLMSVLQGMVANPLCTSHISPAAVFRSIERFHPTLVIDEGDAFMKRNEELRGILNSGHTKHLAYVLRSTGEDYEPKSFSTWSPKAIALIGKLPDTLMDRSIVLKMRRRLPHETVEKLRMDRIEETLGPIQQLCKQWAEENQSVLAEADPPVPEWLNDRAADNWRPLLSIAELGGEEWIKRCHEAIAACEQSQSDESESLGTLILKDIRSVFSSAGTDRIRTVNSGVSGPRAVGLLEALNAMGDRPWASYSNGFPMKIRQLANFLRTFDIHPKTIRFSKTDTAKGYLLDDFRDAFIRYLPVESAEEVVVEADEIGEMLPCYALEEDDIPL